MCEIVGVASLEWAPYVGSRLHQEGLTAGIVKVAARQIGMDAKISYSPWSRTVYAGLNDPNYAGYFPVGDAKALAALLQKSLTDANFLLRLNIACQARAKLFLPSIERDALKNIISSLIRDI